MKNVKAEAKGNGTVKSCCMPKTRIQNVVEGKKNLGPQVNAKPAKKK